MAGQDTAATVDPEAADGLPEAVCLGESMAVLLPERPGPLESVEGFRVSLGGAESNVAGALSALGVRSGWISRVGDDGFGRRLTAGVAARGVDVSAVVVDPTRPTGIYLKEVGGSTGEPYDLGSGRSRLHYYRAGSAAAALSPDLLAEPAAARLLAGARLLHLSGITAALSDGCLELVRALLVRPRPAVTRDLLVSFDLNWRPALWHGRDPAVLPALMDAADVLLLGADEAEAVLGTGDPQALRARFPSPATVVVKDADRLVTAVGRDGTAVGEAALTVEVVEATGAGDAFAAGYLAGTLRGLDQRRRLRLGHLSAACALTAPGDQAELPAREVVAALLDASAGDWAATRVSADGIVSPVLPALPSRQGASPVVGAR
ncbi:sugar kinase [Kitasatospora herbaricolor]|uniref:sugar kinase n=1 Tax=Kitasatospora herbaricolor TaxID=68217 RepID=UPI001747FC19|nr:sugar kinase [Kitasatospora herbaricolor]MDQ0307143.1 2-dehydro-3-deoxygluconokinase [Kitasatospora herbaricolor]GGV29228.1 sugar kinase [Kitasatospora herbaricolor]